MSILSNINYIGFDFDGVFTDNTLIQDQNGKEYIKFSKYDSLFIKALKNLIKIKNLPITLFVISGEKNPIVKYRCDKLGLNCYQGINNKLEFFKKEFLVKNKTNKVNYIYLGNDLNDLKLLKNAYFSCCPSDSPKIIKKYASYTAISTGGNGFIREIIEYLFKDAEIYDEDVIEYIEK